MIAGLQAYIPSHDIYRVMGVVEGYLDTVPKKEAMLGSRIGWVEIDPADSVWKEGETNFAKLDHWRKETIAKLRAYEHPPSRIIDSGRGLWAEWWLAELSDADAVEAFNYAMVKQFDGDHHSWNINRIGRMPGTINHKTGRRAEVVEEAGHTYSLENLPHQTPPAGARSDKVIDADAVAFEDDKAFVDAVSALPIHPDARAAVLYGHDANDPPTTPWGEDRNDMLFFFLCECVRNKVDDGAVIGMCKAGATGQFVKGGFGHLYNHRRGKFKGTLKKNVERNARRQLANAYAKVAEEKPKSEPFDNGTLNEEPEAELALEDLGDTPELGEDRDYIVEGQFERGFYYMVGGKGGEGKSAIMLQVSAAIAIGEATLGLSPTNAFKVLSLNAEDSRAEVNRRLIAIQKTTGWKVPKGRLFTLSREDLVLVVKDPKEGKVDWTPFMRKLEKLIVANKIDVLSLDPLVELHRGLSELDNTDMSQFTVLLKRLIRRTKILVFLVHHNRKGTGQSGDIDSFRGATALINGARGGITVETMSEEFYTKKGIAAKGKRKDFVRLGMAKTNYSESLDDRWLRKVKHVVTPKGHTSIGFELITFGGVVEGTSEGTDWEHYPALIKLFTDGTDKGRLWSSNPRTTPSIIKAMSNAVGLDAGESQQVIQAWVRQGILVEGWQRGTKGNGKVAVYAVKDDHRLISKKDELDV